MPCCASGQAKDMAMPTKRKTIVETMGTKREPPKNDSAFGSTILWYLLCSQATPMPTMMPPKTPI